jgi:hypothetical protein
MSQWYRETANVKSSKFSLAFIITRSTLTVFACGPSRHPPIGDEVLGLKLSYFLVASLPLCLVAFLPCIPRINNVELYEYVY